MYTPGPWEDRQYSESSFAVFEKTGKRIAYCYAGFEDRPKEEAQANARLIAAAPDLLAACKAALEELANMRENESPAAEEEWLLERNLKAAILKAES